MESERQQRGLLFVLSGPAGAGKDAAIKRLKRQMPDLYVVVTATTRPRRRHEAEGRDYFFVTDERFRDMIEQGELLEHALVHSEHYYGVPKEHVRRVLAEGRDAIMRIDVQGAATIRSIAPDTVFIFIRPKSIKELERRLRNRRSEAPEQMAIRLADAPREMAEMSKFDYTVINTDGHLKDAVDDIAAIIRAERCRTKRRQIIL